MMTPSALFHQIRDTTPTGYAEEVEQNKRLVRRLYDELFVKGIRQFYGGIRAGLPDVQLTVEDIIGERDRVVVRWRARATHRGVFLGVPATGKAVSFTGVAIYRLSKGKIVERWVEVGLLGLSEQLRATSAPPGK
jgi:steroid delta-isomerase-like uncharacterized protein